MGLSANMSAEDILAVYHATKVHQLRMQVEGMLRLDLLTSAVECLQAAAAHEHEVDSSRDHRETVE